MSDSYARCHYISPDGLECEQWFKSNGELSLCPVHAGSVSASMASNGINKDPYIEKRNAAQFSLLTATEGMSTVAEKLAYYDQHIAGIERVIEEQKILVLTARAVRQNELEKLSDTEREARRKIRTPKIETAARVKRSSSANDMGKELKAREKAIASIISMRSAQGKSTTREQAIALMEMD
jgi:hypothetical protein